MSNPTERAGAANGQPRGGGQRPPRGVFSHPALCIGLLAIAFRVFSAILAFLSDIVFPDYRPGEPTTFSLAHLFWDGFTRHDSESYYQIARSGYAHVAGGRSDIAFFPVYPLLMRYVGRLFGRRPADVYLGGIVVSWIAFALAMIVLFRLARLDMPRRRAERAVLFAAIFPFAFFYGVVYPESLFLLLTVASFYLFRTRRWVAGGVCGGLAAATSVNGILALPALAWIAWRGAGEQRRQRVGALVGLALVAAGVGAYSLYIYDLTGHPFEWAASMSQLGGDAGRAPWTATARLVWRLVTHPYDYLAGERLGPYDTLNGATALLVATSVPFVWRRFGAAYGLFMAANLWFTLSSGQFEGMGRSCAVLFPCFMGLAGLRSRTATALLLLFSAMFYTLCLALFTNLHPLS